MDIRRRLLFAILILVSVTTAAVVGYRVLGGPEVTLLQALYMAVITLAGVGYGEIVDTSHNPALRVFNMFVVLIGVTLTVYVFSVVTAFLVEGEITNIFWRRKMLKRISRLSNHVILCGLGDTGRHALEELQKTGTPNVVIHNNEEDITKLQQHQPEVYKDILFIIGDATDEEILEQAGVNRASGLLTTLSSEKENLVITVMVRQKNPLIRIVARCTDVKFSERMLKAGANSTVSPDRIGGLRLASEVLRPHVVSFLDLMLKEQSRTLRIEEVIVANTSPWVGKTLGELNFRIDYNLLPMAIKTDGTARDDPGFVINPPDDTVLRSDLVVIFIGDLQDIARARRDAHQLAPVLAGQTQD